ncbi:hypothetical protein IJJ53_00960 [Candidatus Saccharibacteria bacterium]|nr:hypothetical protein [Candidatus Saccharibacteria bacterium]
MASSSERNADIIIGEIAGKCAIHFDKEKFLLDEELVEDMVNHIAANSNFSILLDTSSLKEGVITLKMEGVIDAKEVADATDYVIECITSSR